MNLPFIIHWLPYLCGLMKKLSELKEGQQATILQITNEEALILLSELGCRPGAIVRVEHVAPLQDPIAVSVEGSKFSIRRKMASLVEVDLL